MSAEQWYWDLGTKRAVRASERGKGDDTLGPYDTKAEAENWRSQVEKRNDAWEDADDAWDEPAADD